jgi:hypothetical protein
MIGSVLGLPMYAKPAATHRQSEEAAVIRSQALALPLSRSVVVLCVVSLTLVYAQAPAPAPTPAVQPPASGGQTVKISPNQLDSLVAPIALYPDPLLAQTLAASTYPLEIIQLQQWLKKNPHLKDQALVDAVQKQPWDPSVQAMAGLPDLVKRLADDIQWTADLGNAFLAQESDVMDAVQRMRKKAQDKGNLKSNEHQKVETQVVERQSVETHVIQKQSVIVIEPANPQVVYVPTYDPYWAYGAPYYPYPPIYYPPYGYYGGGMLLSFGIGMAMGAWWAGGAGWGCGWGSANVQVNNFNNFNRNSNIGGGNNLGGGNRVNPLGSRGAGAGAGGAGNRWQHNPAHRGGTPYGDRGTADRFGGTARGESAGNRQAMAQRELGRSGGNLGSTSRGSGSGLADRGGAGGFGGDRASAGGGDRLGGRGADSIGSRDLSRSGGGGRDAFSGGARGYDRSFDRASGSRGSSGARSSGFSSRGGGGGSRGGGGRGGGGGRRR